MTHHVILVVPPLGESHVVHAGVNCVCNVCGSACSCAWSLLTTVEVCEYGGGGGGGGGERFFPGLPPYESLTWYISIMGQHF